VAHCSATAAWTDGSAFPINGLLIAKLASGMYPSYPVKLRPTSHFVSVNLLSPLRRAGSSSPIPSATPRSNSTADKSKEGPSSSSSSRSRPSLRHEGLLAVVCFARSLSITGSPEYSCRHTLASSVRMLDIYLVFVAVSKCSSRRRFNKRSNATGIIGL
jgi:hypothetical protein